MKVERPSDEKEHRSLHGLTRSLINNMVVGVSQGFTKELDINGVGYKATKQGNKVVFDLGYSHPIEIVEPEGIIIDVPALNKIIVKGADKQL
ncbi:MAG TPA: 50S ribosomal protein L6, partial [Saccharofermentans sp.]|nr:50S ribosomal protein L6 [Saccharofermentans sp.]